MTMRAESTYLKLKPLNKASHMVLAIESELQPITYAPFKSIMNNRNSSGILTFTYKMNS